ncbi:matrixin family metalloprotease [Isoptericola sp. NPDC057191]|uniref:matrixin family metalloprotease n=1 Tax=Isoptericola sp. NPDC057191 TaxID=3346041 RepID=UPI0036425B1A
MRSNLTTTALIAALIWGLGTLPAPAATPPSDSPDPGAAPTCAASRQGPVDKSDVPAGVDVVDCRLVGRVISDEDSGLSAPVPSPGETVSVEGLSVDGRSELTVAVDESGTITYPADHHADTGASQSVAVLAGLKTASVGPSECRQTAYRTTGWKVYGNFPWWVGDGARPAGLSTKQFRSVISRSASTITSSRNDCGLGDVVGATHSSRGSTTKEYGHRDHVNVIDFGPLPRKMAGLTTTWSVKHAGRNKVVESDIRLNRNGFAWTTSPGSSACRNRIDVQSVLTHELGHTFGLGHVSNRSYPRMTMSDVVEPCSSSARLLGKGDVRGLAALY